MLETEIVKLREAIEALTAKLVSAEIEVPKNQDEAKTEVPKNQDEAEIEVPKNQDEAPKVTDQQVKDATLAKARDGFQIEIRALLAEFGAKKRQELNEDDYPKFLEALGKIG